MQNEEIKAKQLRKEIPLWEKDKSTLGVVEKGRIIEHIVLESG